MTVNGYDGVDIDMEPLESTDTADYTAFITALRAALNAARPGLLLTAAVEPRGVPTLFNVVQKDFDQINIMTYDLSGPWPGWVSWHDSNLYSAGQKMPSTGAPLPSCDTCVQAYVKAGVAPVRLAIGTAFYGYLWTGVTGPQQPVDTKTTAEAVAYSDIVTTYARTGTYHWDAKAVAPYLTFPATAPAGFLSYDDPALCAAKIQYVRAKGLGGLVCWNIGQDYIPTLPPGRRHPLLAAIDAALRANISPSPVTRH